jgi:hypothetical protein
MAVYYADGSALVKRYVNETGSAWVQVVCDAASQHVVALAHLGLAEIAAALGVKVRQGLLDLKCAIGSCGICRPTLGTSIGWSTWTSASWPTGRRRRSWPTKPCLPRTGWRRKTLGVWLPDGW